VQPIEIWHTSFLGFIKNYDQRSTLVFGGPHACTLTTITNLAIWIKKCENAKCKCEMWMRCDVMRWTRTEVWMRMQKTFRTTIPAPFHRITCKRPWLIHKETLRSVFGQKLHAKNSIEHVDSWHSTYLYTEVNPEKKKKPEKLPFSKLESVNKVPYPRTKFLRTLLTTQFLRTLLSDYVLC
jgi:hypothetical protein